MSSDIFRCPECNRRIAPDELGRFCLHCAAEIDQSSAPVAVAQALEPDSADVEPVRSQADEQTADEQTADEVILLLEAKLKEMQDRLRRQEDGLSPSSADSNAASPQREDVIDKDSSARDVESPVGSELPEALEPVLQETIETPDFSDLTPVGNGNGSSLQVRFNASSIFIAGCEMPFHFQVSPNGEGISDLCIEVLHKNRIIARDENPWHLNRREQIDLPLGFCPDHGLHGFVTFLVQIGYRLNGEHYWYGCKLTQTVHRANTDGATAIRDINISVQNNLQQGHAADAEISNSLDLDALGKLNQYRGSAAELQLADMPARWLVLKLHRLTDRVNASSNPNDPPAVALANRLLLRHGQRELMLLDAPALQIGRNRECDIMARVYDQDGTLNRDLSRMISRFHARIEFAGTTLLLLDMAWNPIEKQRKPSACGTFLNGRQLASGGREPLPLDKPFQIGLAGPFSPVVFEGLISSNRQNSACTYNFAKHLPAAPANLVLKRKRDASAGLWQSPACAVVWTQMDLGGVWPEFSGTCLCRRGEAFMLRCGAHCQWLIPGQSLRLSGQTVEILKINASKESQR